MKFTETSGRDFWSQPACNALFTSFNSPDCILKKNSYLSVRYKEIQVPASYRIDIHVENKIVLELKAVEEANKIYVAQLLTYMRLGKYPIGILFNFNVPLLKDGGIKRFVL